MFVTFFNCTISNQNSTDESAKLQGSWVNESDLLWKLLFEGEKLTQIYENEILEECHFSVNKESCDSLYSSIEAVYLIYSCKEKKCFEISSLSNATFSYRDTSTGRLHTFNKINN